MSEDVQYINDLGIKTRVLVNELPVACPHCEKPAKFKCLSVFEHHQDPDEGSGFSIECIFRCNEERCERIFIAEYLGEIDLVTPLELQSLTPVRHWEGIKELIEDDRVPARVKEDLLETNGCYKNGYYQAFGAMVRRVVHSICEERGAVGRDLHRQIEDLRTRQVMSEDVIDRAHELRTLGRHGAHPEWETVTREMADLGIQHLLWIIRTVYQRPPDNAWRKSGRRR